MNKENRYVGAMPITVEKVRIIDVSNLHNGFAYHITNESDFNNPNLDYGTYYKKYIYAPYYSLIQNFITNNLGCREVNFLNKTLYVVNSHLFTDNRLIALITEDNNVFIVNDLFTVNDKIIESKFGVNKSFIEYYSGLTTQDFKSLLLEEQKIRKLEK